MTANFEYEMVAANSIEVGDEITFAEEVAFMVNRVEDAEDDGVTFHMTVCDSLPSRTLASMTFAKKANIKRIK